MSRQFALLLLTGFFLSAAKAHGTVFLSAENLAARAVASALEYRLAKHSGKHAGSWGDLDRDALYHLETRLSYASPTRRYAILDGSVRLPYPHAGRVLAIMRRASYESIYEFGSYWTPGLRGPGRYVICLADNGEVTSPWLSESAVQSAFAHAGQALPVPDHEPYLPGIRKAWLGIWVWRAFNIAAAIFIIMVLYRRKVMAHPRPIVIETHR